MKIKITVHDGKKEFIKMGEGITPPKTEIEVDGSIEECKNIFPHVIKNLPPTCTITK